jgi:hypothetical protein
MNKPRLIDANEYLQKVCTYKETGCGSCKFQECCPKDQPTAYDVTSVVEQMTMESFFSTDCEYLGKLVSLEDAIEIVKGGQE